MNKQKAKKIRAALRKAGFSIFPKIAPWGYTRYEAPSGRGFYSIEDALDYAIQKGLISGKKS